MFTLGPPGRTLFIKTNLPLTIVEFKQSPSVGLVLQKSQGGDGGVASLPYPLAYITLKVIPKTPKLVNLYFLYVLDVIHAFPSITIGVPRAQKVFVSPPNTKIVFSSPVEQSVYSILLPFGRVLSYPIILKLLQ